MSNPTAAMLVIGDEILSGRTRDSNTNHLAKALTEVGIDLKEARVVSDDQPAIVAAVRTLSDAYDHVFTSGGIGPTHDDITADAMGAAFDAHVDVRDDARALLQAHYDRAGTTLNEARLRMARIPDGATLIDNPVSTAPGFTIKNVNVMAGVPSVFEAMVASVISKLAHGAPLLSESWRVMRGEGDVAAPLAQIATDHPDLSLGSYPFQKDGAYGTNIVIRGTEQTRVTAAMTQLQALFPA
jgi:molybdenum cofactor synthesis domain-containing protein